MAWALSILGRCGKRLHGVPDDYELGSSKTVAGEAIGQGVLVNLFATIISTLTRSQVQNRLATAA